MAYMYPASIQNSKTFIRFAPKTTVTVSENKSDTTGTKKTKQKEIKHSTKSDGVIYLYLPPTLTSQTNIEWNEEDTRIYGQIKDIITSGDMFGSAQNKFKGRGLEAMLSALTGGTPQAMIQKEKGVVTNPERDIFFKGIGFREFQFSFDFVPETAKEAEEVRNIILTFKRYSLPNFSANKALLTYPPLWSIESIVEGNKLQDYKDCYLTSASFNYAPDQIVALFNDGKPVKIHMDLTFKESELVTESDYAQSQGIFGY